MTSDTPPSAPGAASDAGQRSLVDDVRQLAQDSRTLLDAELAYQKSRAAVAGAGAKGVAGWGALALALAFFTLMALVMGLLLILSVWLGPLWATLAMVAGLLLATGLAALAARARWSRTARLLADQDAAP